MKDSEDDQIKEEGFHSRISSAAFLMIMEDCIQTFMNFLKADKARPCQVIAAFFKRHKRSSVDPALLTLMKKVNNKVSLYYRPFVGDLALTHINNVILSLSYSYIVYS